MARSFNLLKGTFMHNKFFKMSLSVWFGFMTNVYAESSFITYTNDFNQAHAKRMEAKAFHKIAFARFQQNNELDLSFGQLKDADMPAVINYLNKHPEVTSLNLEGNSGLTAVGLVPLAAIDSLK